MRKIQTSLIRLVEGRNSVLEKTPKMPATRASPSPASARNSPAPSSAGSSFRTVSRLSNSSRRSAIFDLPPAPNMHTMRLRSGVGGNVEGGSVGDSGGTPRGHSSSHLRASGSLRDVETYSTGSHHESVSIRRRREEFSVQENTEASLRTVSTVSTAAVTASQSQLASSRTSRGSLSITDARLTTERSAANRSTASIMSEGSFGSTLGMSFGDDIDSSLLVPDLPPPLPPLPATPPGFYDTPDRLALGSAALSVGFGGHSGGENRLGQLQGVGGTRASVDRVGQAGAAVEARSATRTTGLRMKTFKGALKTAADKSSFLHNFPNEYAYRATNFVSCLERHLCARGSTRKAFLVLTFICLFVPFLLAMWRCRDPSVAFRLSLPSSSSYSYTPSFRTSVPLEASPVTSESSVSTDVHKNLASDDSPSESRWNFFGALSGIGSSVVNGPRFVLMEILKRTTAAVNLAASTARKFIPSFEPQNPVHSQPGPTPVFVPPVPPSPCECPSTTALVTDSTESPDWSGSKAPPPPCPPATDPATQARLEVLSGRIDELKAELIAVSQNQSSAQVYVLEEARDSAETAVREESGKIWESMRKIEAQLMKVKTEQDELKEELTRVVRENVDVTLRQVVAAFQQPPSNDASDVFSSPAFGFAAWLRSELDHEGETRGLYLETKLKEYINSTFVSAHGSETAEEKEQKETRALGVDLEMVTKIVKEQIILYDADKTGKPDFALESSGGTIVSTRCSEEYREGFAEYYFFGIPLWWTKTSPRNAIQPRVSPGECWAFKGDQGYLVIQLANPIYVTGFTVEHIPKTISITGEIKSAPKDFVVYGLNGERDPNPMEFGSYTYSYDGEPVQYFPVKKHQDVPHAFVELNIRSNWGHPEYTCLYRIRVHGTRP